jgi:beta-lactam-binding protein with PASTA domain/predicted Ser/Thr protein kinase
MSTPPHLSDRYELGEILGFGGMSEVHLARDLRLHRDVAVKVLRADLARDPSFYLRFRREAQNAAALNHPAIVAVYDTGEAATPAGPLPYIVMEYVDGVTLRDIVHTDGPMPARRALEVIADACQALNFSHQHGIVHRDVKPANIMISKTGSVKVMDFGIARAIADGGNSVTATAAVIGTAQYLSPEQARGEQVDARSDVYSLGCVLYEVLTGQPPFVGDSPVAVAYQHVREDPVPPSQKRPDISPELDAVVLKALAKNPDNRYQSAAEMRNDLVRVHSGEKPDAPKVMTHADRTMMMSSSRPGHRGDGASAPVTYDYSDTERASGPVGKWLVALSILAILTVVVTLAINMVGGKPRALQVPDVRGQVSADAIAELQNRGFKIRTQQKPDNVVAPDHVISTDPAGNTSVSAGDEVQINVSTGPEQREVPDVSALSYADAVKKLTAAGFGKFKQTGAASNPDQKNKVLSTIPPANQTSALTNEITIVVGTGPATRDLPDVVGQTSEVATRNLNTLGFPTILTAPVDSPEPAGQVLATDPPAGTSATLDTAVTLRVSKGNQFIIPNLTGQFWVDAEPNLRALGWTGVLVKGPDVPNSGQRTNAVVTQSPAPGAGVNFGGSITLSFAS